MKQLLPIVAVAAIGLGGLTGCSMWHHNDQTASAKSSEGNSRVIGSGGDTSFSEGGTARIEDHRSDAGKARPASEKQSPATNDDNNNDFSD